MENDTVSGPVGEITPVSQVWGPVLEDLLSSPVLQLGLILSLCSVSVPFKACAHAHTCA
jgi:hypothetical protein